jgi:hypothetical protein
MANMEVKTPEVTREVQDYDFTFQSGSVLSVTVDKEAGDTYDVLGTVIKIHIAEKPSFADLEATIPAEDITVYERSLAAIQKRNRTLTLIGPEEQYEMKQLIHELAKGVQ